MAIRFVGLPPVHLPSGKVTSLRCEHHAEEWLATAPTLGHRGVDQAPSAFDAEQSWGWDECFPTVLPCESMPWGRSALRDHGELWGRPWELTTESRDTRQLTFTDESGRFTFDRHDSLTSPASMTSSYSAQNFMAGAIPVLWSQHAVLRGEAGTTIQATFDQSRMTVAPFPSWIADTLGLRINSVDLGRLPSPDSSTVVKTYLRVPDGTVTAKRPSGCSLTWKYESIATPWFGLYVNLGGWPSSSSPLYQFAIEPTFAPFDDLESARVDQQATIIEPGGRIRWSVAMTLDAQDSDV